MSASIPPPKPATKGERASWPKNFGREVNNYLTTFIHNTDDKARTVATLDTVALGVVMAWNKANGLVLVHALTIALLIVGAALAAWVIFPRMPRASSGVIFWEDIRGHASADVYYQTIQKLSPQEVETGYAQQNYYVSQVLHKKNVLTRWSMIVTALGVVSAIVDYWWL